MVTAPAVNEATCDARAMRRKVSLVARYASASLSDITDGLRSPLILRKVRPLATARFFAITASMQ
jgi:hypothetical protein